MKINENEITMRIPDNWHVHFRQGMLLKFLVALFIQYGWRGRLVAEPNTDPAILTGEHAQLYSSQIMKLQEGYHRKCQFKPVMTIQITESTTPKMIHDASRIGVRVCKVYPRYVTTNSSNGVVEYKNIYPALREAERLGMIIQFHGEHPSYEVVGRKKEAAFIKILSDIRLNFPNLRISVEHVSSKIMCEWVDAQPAWVGASITVHHMHETADTLAGYSERGGGLCCVDDGAFKPGAKDPEDRDAVCERAMSGSPKYWNGNDDAWHLGSKKHCSKSSCGAGNTIAALSMSISKFKQKGKIDRLEYYLSESGATFYGYPLNNGVLTFRREDWIVPTRIEVPGTGDYVTPYRAGDTMEWKLVA